MDPNRVRQLLGMERFSVLVSGSAASEQPSAGAKFANPTLSLVAVIASTDVSLFRGAGASTPSSKQNTNSTGYITSSPQFVNMNRNKG